ncbi:MAG: sulfotransferase family protein [Gammaproteobacteria bacterium]|nr:sulfotransferase family protein [Gammaproteobacteria bacterium]
MTTPICLWSGPRNVSTALMYSFSRRPDVRVVDEPLYGHYLRVTGAGHPGRDEIIASMNCDGAGVMKALLDEQQSQPAVRLFLKHMAHHLVAMDLGFLRQVSNVFLIRDPREMLPSLTVQLPAAQLADTGLKRQWQLFSRLRDDGPTPVVVDSRELLLDPGGVLSRLCDALGLSFDPAMLSWPAGPIQEDGIWAPHWYHAIHRTTGFQPYRPKAGFPEHLRELLAECRPWYDKLFDHALRARDRGD